MDRKNTSLLVIGILLGLGGGLIGGYQLASSDNVMREKDDAVATPPTQIADANLSELEKDEETNISKFDSIVIPFVPFEDGCDIQTFITWFGCRTSELNLESSGLHITVGHPLAHDREFSNIKFRFSGRNLTPRQLLDVFSKQTGIRYSISPCAVLWEQEKPKEAEQDGADEPTTAPQLEPSHNDNLNPES